MKPIIKIRKKTKRLIKAGYIKKTNCIECNLPYVEIDHLSDDPKNIEFRCKYHHTQRHKQKNKKMKRVKINGTVIYVFGAKNYNFGKHNFFDLACDYK